MSVYLIEDVKPAKGRLATQVLEAFLGLSPTMQREFLERSEDE